MKSALFPRLAWTGIKRNRQLYIPYILTCTGTVMMFEILAALMESPRLESMRGGSTTRLVLGLGCVVIAVFAMVFLFYTNSFLIRRRNREFGLYNVLGMDKRRIGRILLWEDLMVSLISLAGGMLLGVVLGKLGELALMNILRSEISYSFSFSLKALGATAEVFAVIFVLIALNGLRLLRKNDPLALMHSEAFGEKPPKSNWVLALLGALLLGAAYAIAATTRSPMIAILVFFVAVIMVIAATYMLMISGSVTLCRTLQKNKRYYYQSRHFVSVSSMAYRMKRNGAGLASICILCTMVLVMISSSGSLFVGAEDCIRGQYPRELAIKLYGEGEPPADSATQAFRDLAQQRCDEAGMEQSKVLDFHASVVYGLLKNGRLEPSREEVTDFQALTDGDIVGMVVVPLSDYIRSTGNDVSLADDEVLVYTRGVRYTQPTLKVDDGATFRVAGTAEDFDVRGSVNILSIPGLYVFVNDPESIVAPLRPLRDMNERALLTGSWYYGFDVEGSSEERLTLYSALWDGVGELTLPEQNNYSYSVQSAEDSRSDFYASFGGLFFIGIILSILFLSAAVLIIYYKQVCEGYEDQPRFAIMRQVGMTDTDIRKSVDSQVLTVFFAPLAFSGLHLIFACPIVWVLLKLFGLYSVKLFIAVTAGAFAVFALFYVIVYRLTSRVYYHLVRSSDD